MRRLHRLHRHLLHYPTRPPIRPRTLATTAQPDAPTHHRKPQQTEPSTRHALPHAGGDDRAHRHSLHAQLHAAWRRVNLPPHANFHPADIAPGADAVFVGVGLDTNWPALLAAVEGNVFGERRVAVVRDVFDRSSDRRTLADWFAFVADDVIAVLDSVVKPSCTERRLVNEFVVAETGYKLVKRDVELIEYLHASGIRVVPVSSKQRLRRMQTGEEPIPVQQSTNHVLACAPTAFSYNSAAAADNHFMQSSVGGVEAAVSDQVAMRRQVLTEFAHLHARLVDRDGVGAQVHLFTHEDWHNTPDACFPNNTFSTHNNIETGDSSVLVLYPMKAETRRKERRLVQRLLTRGRYTTVHDLTREEEGLPHPRFLEGTGSLVLDRVNRIAYVALSQRSDGALAATWARIMNYTVLPFHATDRQGRAIYHTNVMMSVGTGVAVVCTECIPDERERAAVLSSLAATGHDVVDISYDQVEMFCGNVLELENFYAEPVMVMSTGAYEGFGQALRDQLLDNVARIVHSDISTIERIGGGGVRCTIAELH